LFKDEQMALGENNNQITIALQSQVIIPNIKDEDDEYGNDLKSQRSRRIRKRKINPRYI
jgi:hypothetical protein